MTGNDGTVQQAVEKANFRHKLPHDARRKWITRVSTSRRCMSRVEGLRFRRSDCFRKSGYRDIERTHAASQLWWRPATSSEWPNCCSDLQLWRGPEAR